MTRRKRRNHSAAFKATVAALTGEKTLAELAEQFGASLCGRGIFVGAALLWVRARPR